MRLTVSLALAGLVLAAACGVPVQQSPVPVRPEAMPSQLRDGTAPQTPIPTTADSGKSTVLIHFVRNDRLVGLFRQAPTTSEADRLNAVVAALMVGPTDSEQAQGITSALPPGLQLTVVALHGQQVTLGLAGETEGRSATENVLAVGQIVLSVTSLTTVTEVTFARDGTPVEALLADGALTTKPLTAADYAELKAP